MIEWNGVQWPSPDEVVIGPQNVFNLLRCFNPYDNGLFLSLICAMKLLQDIINFIYRLSEMTFFLPI